MKLITSEMDAETEKWQESNTQVEVFFFKLFIIRKNTLAIILLIDTESIDFFDLLLSTSTGILSIRRQMWTIRKTLPNFICTQRNNFNV